MHVFSRYVGGLEDVLEVLMGNRGEVRAIFRGNAQHHGIGGQCFTLTLGHVLGEFVHHTVHGEP
ncbi:hypothetical protein D3C84_1310740 [compost metagenome]